MVMFMVMWKEAEQVLTPRDFCVTSFCVITPCHIDVISLVHVSCFSPSSSVSCALWSCGCIVQLSATHTGDRQLMQTECINVFPYKSSFKI